MFCSTKILHFNITNITLPCFFTIIVLILIVGSMSFIICQIFTRSMHLLYKDFFFKVFCLLSNYCSCNLSTVQTIQSHLLAAQHGASQSLSHLSLSLQLGHSFSISTSLSLMLLSQSLELLVEHSFSSSFMLLLNGSI